MNRLDAMTREELERVLAGHIIQMSVGDRLPTLRQMSATHHASLGALQAALGGLEKKGAVGIERRGRLGAYLRDRAVGALWNAAQGDSPLVVAFPLPSTRICEGLATAVKATLVSEGIETFFIFVRGSRNRIGALRGQRCHVAVVSSLSAQEISGPTEVTILELPPNTYVDQHHVYYADGQSGPGQGHLRVAIDRDSADLQRLSELEFQGISTEWVKASYLHYASLIAEGKVDAVVWDIDEAIGRLKPSVRHRPLSDAVLRQIGQSNTRAMFVGRRADIAVSAVISECLNSPSLLQIQRDVVDGVRVPEY